MLLPTFVVTVLQCTVVSGQIQFGTRKNTIQFGSQPNGNPVSFTSLSQPVEQSIESDSVSLKSLLNKMAPPVLTKRFNFGSSRSKEGQSCRTPTDEAGTCEYITNSQCGSVLNDILQNGIDRNMLNYLLQAIKRPCGWQSFDFTLCCDTPQTTTTTSTTTTTTTTQTTTTTTTTKTSTTTSTTSTTTTEKSTSEEIDCGVSKYMDNPVRIRAPWKNRIVGGRYSKQGAWPWAVIIGRVLDSSGKYQVICGGTLIDQDTILTAAHCLDPVAGIVSPDSVRLGEHDIRVGVQDGAKEVVDIKIEAAIQHPSWNSITLENDIAIIKLESNVTYNRDVRPACLPESYRGEDLTNLLSVNNQAVIVGWGATQTGGRPETKLRQTTVPVTDLNLCQKAYGEVGIDISQLQFCAGFDGKDTCSGDSGGSLLSNRLGGQFSVVGITSFGVECARPDFPGVYTRVDPYLDWIRSHM